MGVLYFGDDITQLVKDLSKGRDTRDVRFLGFNAVVDVQPLTRGQMPLYYLQHPNLRMFYSLKTFSLRRLDAYRRESVGEIRKGNTGKGIKNLARMGFVLSLADAGPDVIKDWMSNKPVNLTDIVVNNLLSIGLMHSYVADRADRVGWPKALLEHNYPPITGLAIDAGKDITDISKGEFDITKTSSVRNVPIAGRIIDDWFGKSAEAKARREGKQRR